MAASATRSRPVYGARPERSTAGDRRIVVAATVGPVRAGPRVPKSGPASRLRRGTGG